MEMENDPANPCVGCGPGNPMGLRLRFERADGAVVARLRVAPEHQGAPDRIHSALVYLAMTETANWTVYGLLGRVGLPVRTGALDLRRWIAVGETIAFRGTLSGTSVVVEATDEAGRTVARLERDFALPGRAEFARRLGYEKLPSVYDGLIPEA